MAMKCVRKLMLIMMELLILILLGVQANDLALTSFSPSSSLFMSPYSSELDHNHGELHLCLTLGIRYCSTLRTTWPHSDAKYESCIVATFFRCFEHIKFYEDPIMMPIIFNCIKTKCEPLQKIEEIFVRSSQMVRCLLKCFSKHVASPSDVIYLQNP
jgi:hypothetical protein